MVNTKEPNHLTKQIPSFYEFHYKCYFENLDPTNWKTNGEDVLECNMGYHQYQTTLDWSLISMPYLPSFDTSNWKCTDSHQFFDDKSGFYA